MAESSEAIVKKYMCPEAVVLNLGSLDPQGGLPKSTGVPEALTVQCPQRNELRCIHLIFFYHFGFHSHGTSVLSPKTFILCYFINETCLEKCHSAEENKLVATTLKKRMVIAHVYSICSSKVNICIKWD